MHRNSLQVVHPFHEKGKPATSRSFAVKPVREQKRSLKWKNSKSKCKTRQEENLLKSIKYNDPTSRAKIPFFASCQRLIRVLGELSFHVSALKLLPQHLLLATVWNSQMDLQSKQMMGSDSTKPTQLQGERGMFLFFWTQPTGGKWWSIFFNKPNNFLAKHNFPENQNYHKDVMFVST